MGIYAGYGQADITPKVGGSSGFGKIESIDGKLYVKIIYLYDDCTGEQAVLAMVDIGGITIGFDKDLRKTVSQTLDISQERVYINTSHNHTAPKTYLFVHELFAKYGEAFVDEVWVKHVKDSFVSAAKQAKSTMVPVYKKLGRYDVQNIAANRSIKTKAGEYGTRFGFGGDDYIKNQTEGLIDPEVVVLQFIGMDEKPIVTIFNYTCHSTSIKWGKIISPDFSGYACDLIEEKTDAPAFFLQGACGNVGTGKYADGSIDVAKKMGAELASSVLNALKTATVCSKNALEVYTWEEDIVLSDHLPSLDEAYSELDRLAKSKVSISSLWKAAAMIEVLENRKELVKSRLFLIKSGMWCVAGLPAESFVESALAIKGASQYKYTMVSAYYDCTLWYIPTWRAYDKGGFEVQGGWSYTSEGTSETLSRSVIQKL